MNESVDGADDTVSPLRFVAGEVGQLPEDDIDPDSADEPHHHGVRHEPQDRTEPQKPGDQHHSAGKHRQGKQCPRRVTGRVNRRDISDDDSHGPSGLDSHEGRAGEKRATDGAEQVCVKARKRADPGEQAGGEAVGNALHAEHQAGDGVLAQRVTPDPEAESHAKVFPGGRGRGRMDRAGLLALRDGSGLAPARAAAPVRRTHCYETIRWMLFASRPVGYLPVI